MKTENSSILILLAGGKSERMGTPKGLLLYKKSYWVLEQINRFSTVNDATVYIGLGHDYDYYFKAISWFKKALHTTQIYNGVKVRVIVNNQPENGLFSTLQSVLTVVDKTRSVLILPIDVPLLKETALHKMMDVQNKIVIPTYKHKNGHPVKLHSNFWATLLQLSITDVAARLDIQIKKTSEKECTLIAVNDAQILCNLNTPKNWTDFISEI